MTQDSVRSEYSPPVEPFPPPAFPAPRGGLGWLIFVARLVCDVRVGSIWRNARRELGRWSGVVLDVGCGDGPWRWLLRPQAHYIGLDVPRASSTFGYRPRTFQQIQYGGGIFPFRDRSFDHILCTEVLEHIEDPAEFVAECGRVMRIGGTCFFSVPFAARYHYVPFDYWRFTPAALGRLFDRKCWDEVRIIPLGTDITVAAYKVDTLILKLVMGESKLMPRWLSYAIGLIVSPLILFLTLIQNLSAIKRWGSELDPLGYVVLARKRGVGSTLSLT